MLPQARDGRRAPGAGDQARLGVRPGVRWTARAACCGSVRARASSCSNTRTRQQRNAADRRRPRHPALRASTPTTSSPTRDRIVAAGGTALEGPLRLPREESGEGNRWLYTVAPWGGIIELVSYPSPQGYEATTTSAAGGRLRAA